MLTAATAKVPEPSLLEWARQEWLLVVITIGVALDWLPWVLTPYVSHLGTLSGTRLLVLPGLAVACVTQPSWILRPRLLGVVYLLALMVGGGLGWLAGTVETQRLIAISVNGLILLYFLQMRSLVSIRRVLAITFVCSLLVPVVQALTKLGVVTPAMLARLGVVLVPGDDRIFSVFDSTTVGLVPLMIAACLGGLIFIRSRRFRTMLSAVGGVALIGFGVTSALVAQQRSGVIAYAVSALVGLVLFVVFERVRPIWRRHVLLVVAVAVLLPAWYARDWVEPVRARFTDAPAYEGAKDLRLGGLTTFVADLADDPWDPVPKGHQSLLHRAAVEPHLILSEAYYEGGPLFLAAVVAILIKFGASSVSLLRSADGNARTIGACLCAFGCGAAIQVMLQTALALRLIPLVLGVGIAAARIARANAVRAAAALGTGGPR